MESLQNCLITGLPVVNGLAEQGPTREFWHHRYNIQVDDKQFPVSICDKLYYQLYNSDQTDPLNKFITENRGVIINELAKDDFELFRTKMLHMEYCKPFKDETKHVAIKSYIEAIIEKGDFPKTRKEKYSSLLNYLLRSQPYDAGPIKIKKGAIFYSRLYFQSYEELEIYLKDMQQNEVINYNEETGTVNFRFTWLDKIEADKKNVVVSKPNKTGEVENITEMIKKIDLPFDAFICYAHADEEYKSELIKHLAILQRNGLIKTWHDADILPGKDWEIEISNALSKSKLLLLLISPDFFHSTYIYEKEMALALERYKKNEAIIIPIILRISDFGRSPLHTIQALPKHAKPIKQWEDQDEAFHDVVNGIDKVIQSILTS